jgi:peptide-methionine (S)-S-oxide reductase
VIFYTSDEQKAIAEQVMAELDAAQIWDDPIVTELRSAATFYRAEDYHQDYFRNNAQQPYCTFVVAPKVRKFREKFAHKIKRSA